MSLAGAPFWSRQRCGMGTAWISALPAGCWHVAEGASLFCSGGTPVRKWVSHAAELWHWMVVPAVRRAASPARYWMEG